MLFVYLFSKMFLSFPSLDNILLFICFVFLLVYDIYSGFLIIICWSVKERILDLFISALKEYILLGSFLDFEILA